jgi:TM2 domain-containing membrane protein YozV
MTPTKDPGIAAIIALLAGLIGLMGMGHIYVGRIARGVAILVAGIALWFLASFSFFLALVAIGSILWLLSLACLVAAVGLLIWQTYDAYNLARRYNAAVQQTGRAPW